MRFSGTMSRRMALSRDAEELGALARVLGASVNAAVLRELLRARRRGEGWMYLSEIAEAIGESPGSVSAGVQRLSMLVEERREKGLRYFRARYAEVRLELDGPR